MTDLFDYIEWRGDLPLTAVPLCDVDALLFARLSYMPFEGVVPTGFDHEKPLPDAARQLLAKAQSSFVNFRTLEDKRLLEKLLDAPRYQGLALCGYETEYDKENEEQFAALTIRLPLGLCVAFRGTDGTLVGWKEDFNLAYMENIPAQIEALDYLKKQAKKYNNKKILIGGHSKGGNIAIYSGIKASKKIQKRIVKISNYDGPGFSHNMIESIENPEIISRIHSVIPQESVIGRLLEHREKTYIVKSNEKGLYQHDIFSWEVFKDDIVRLPNVDKFSEVVNDTVREWLKKTTPEQRKIFVDGIFGILYSTEVSTFREFWSSILRNTPTMFKAYKGINEKDRKMITNMMKEFGKSYYSSFRKNNGKKAKKEAIS